MTIMHHFLFVIFCCLVSPISVSSQNTDTLQQGNFLNSSSQLISANKLFNLGFYNPNPPNSQNIYLAIWSNNGTFYNSQFPVWIANRNTPIRNNSVILSLDSSGNLFIKSNNTSVDSLFFKLYSSDRRIGINTTATLLGNGNFVVRETNFNGSVGKLLWQSFDYPTDTLLPGMKLGVNHRTGFNRTVTSWLSDTRPENGAFSLEWDPVKLRLVIRRRGVISWTSGSLKEGKFSGAKDKVFEFFWPDSNNFNYQFISEKNEDEEYFYYKLTKTSIISNRNIVSGWFLDYKGSLYYLVSGNVIAALENCYGTVNRSATQMILRGCESWERPKCRNIHQKFDLRSGGFRKPEGDISLGFYDSNLNFSSSDCREKCWRNCSCVGYRFDDPGCLIWSGPDLIFEQDYSGLTARQFVLISEPSKKNAESKKWKVIVTAVVVSFATLMFGVLFCCLKRKRRQGKEKEMLELMTLDGYTETIVLERDGKNGQELKFFSYSCIVTATNSFSAENKLGEGGFGPVYKGKLPEGKEIAVKRLSKSSGQGLHEFKTELILIAKLQHTNLVRLFGCCIHGDDKMLIYEYMPNKSLDFFLFDQTSSQQLTWERRFIIIEGIAQGLLYLHKYSRLRIIHRDLKSSNILLDENMNPKISDFGTARIFKKNLSEVNTNKITGTRGYMAPEYLTKGTFSVKSDVFSYGVLMLEIVSGRRNNSFFDIEGPLNLVAYAWELWNTNSAIQLIDSAMIGSSSSEIHDQVFRCIHIGLLCVQHSATLRPKISDVIYMLSNDNSALPTPTTPAFYQGPTTIRGNIERMKSEKFSVNGLTISDVGAR